VHPRPSRQELDHSPIGLRPQRLGQPRPSKDDSLTIRPRPSG